MFCYKATNVTLVNSLLFKIRLQLNHRSLDYKVTSYHIEKLCVCGDSGQSVKFSIIPLKLGHIPLTVTATSSSAKLCPSSSVIVQDAVTRKLLVEVNYDINVSFL